MRATLYGIPNCDTVRKARNWLDANGVDHVFHDYRTDGVPEACLRDWVADKGWEVLLNRRGTTFRKLDDVDKAEIDANKAIALMLAHPSMIKRPVVVCDGGLLVGFAEAEWVDTLL